MQTKEIVCITTKQYSTLRKATYKLQANAIS